MCYGTPEQAALKQHSIALTLGIHVLTSGCVVNHKVHEEVLPDADCNNMIGRALWAAVEAHAQKQLCPLQGTQTKFRSIQRRI